MPPVTVTRSAYGVEAFLCDGSTGTQLQLAPGLPFVQGNLVTLCVQPDADSRADGVVMDRIESFTWNKEQSTITQPAVANGSVHGNGLSVYSCAPDKAYCTISSILSAGFYESAGLVGGIGAAYLGFDNGNNNNNDIGEAEVVQVQPVLRDFLLDLTGGNGRDNNDNDGSDATSSSSNAAVENGFVGTGTFEELLNTTEEVEPPASNEFNVSATTGGGAGGDDYDGDSTDDVTSTNTSAFERLF